MSDMELYSPYDFARRAKHESAASDRAPFEVDKGRIVHSAAFRRLQGKTQVLGVGERDFYRTRLTHSLEVAQLGRGLCAELESPARLSQDLVETICLAHDIGHPPFGHSGEEFLNSIMRRHGGFGANPQNLRLVTVLEAKYDDSGLDLTRATLDGLVKYPDLFDSSKDQKCKFTYGTDIEILKWIKEGVLDPLRKPIEGQLADWADQMAYSVNDTEDVIRAGLLSFTEMDLRAELISDAATRKFLKTRNERGESAADVPEELSPDYIRNLAKSFEEQFARPPQLRERKANLKRWTSETIKTLRKDCRIQHLQSGEPSIRYRLQLIVPPAADALAVVLKTIAALLVFNDPRVTTLEAKGQHIVRVLFRTLCRREDLLPLDFQELIKSNRFGSKERLVADFLSGMTDRYAYVYYKRLFHPGTGSFYEDV